MSHHLVIVFLGKIVCFHSQLIESSLYCDKWPFGCCFYYTYYFRNPALLVCVLLRFEFTISQRFMEKKSILDNVFFVGLRTISGFQKLSLELPLDELLYFVVGI